MEKFSLDNVENDAQSIVDYVQECMKKRKLSTIEIDEYVEQAMAYDHANLVKVSEEYIDMLNKMDPSEQPEVKVTYLW